MSPSAKKKAKKTIRAAGGLIFRGDTPSSAQLLVVHRPEYDDWSIPKGKHDAGEASEECALREVWEETAYRCRIVGKAGTTRYRVRKGPKEVEYFLMRPVRFEGFLPNDEVDELRWVSPAEAVRMLTYDFDRELVEGLEVEAAVADTTVHLVRHAAAGDRTAWEGPDRDRPLTGEGLAEAKGLAGELSEVGITRILTSPYLRCVQTVEPMADQIGVPVETSDDLAEGAGPRELDRLLSAMQGSTVVLCSHGDVVPSLLERLQWMGVAFPTQLRYEKASTWSIGYDGNTFTNATYSPPPVS